MQPGWRRLRCFVLLAVLLGSVMAADPRPTGLGECAARTGTGSVVVLVCPPGLEERAWREAGQKACATSGQCNAWIWDNPSKAPQQVPKTDAEITKAQAADAVAVWINDTQHLMLLRRVGK